MMIPKTPLRRLDERKNSILHFFHLRRPFTHNNNNILTFAPHNLTSITLVDNIFLPQSVSLILSVWLQNDQFYRRPFNNYTAHDRIVLRRPSWYTLY